MEWWKTTDIVNSFADAVNAQMNKAIGSYTNKYKELMTRNAQNEAEAKAKAQQIFKARANAKRCANAEDRLRRANKHLLELGFTDQIPITQDTINREMSGGFASDVIQQALTGSYQAREKELLKAAEHDVKLTTPNWNKMTYEAQQDLIQQNYQAKVKAMYPEGRYSLADPSSFTYQYSVDKLVEGGYMEAPPEQGEPVTSIEEWYPNAVISEQGVEIENGLILMPDYSVVSSNQTIGRIDPKTGDFIEKELAWWEKLGNILKWLPPNIPSTLIEKYGLAAIEKVDLPFMIQDHALELNKRQDLTAEQSHFMELYKEEVGEPPTENLLLSIIHQPLNIIKTWVGADLSPSEELKEAYYDSTGVATRILHGVATPLSVALFAAGGLGGATAGEARLAKVAERGGKVGRAAQVGQMVTAPMAGFESIASSVTNRVLGGILSKAQQIATRTALRAEAARVGIQLTPELEKSILASYRIALEQKLNQSLVTWMARNPTIELSNDFQEKLINTLLAKASPKWSAGIIMDTLEGTITVTPKLITTSAERAATELTANLPAVIDGIIKTPAVGVAGATVAPAVVVGGVPAVTLIPSTLEAGVYSIKMGDESVGAVATFPQEDSLFVNRISIKEEGTVTRSMLVQLDNLLGNMAKEQGKQFLRIAVREENLGLYKRAGYIQEEGTNIVRKDVSEYQYAPTTAQVEAVKLTTTAEEITAKPTEGKIIPETEAVAKEPWQMTRKEATALYLEEIAKDTPDPNDAIRLNKLANNIRNLPEGEKIKVDSPYLKAEVSVGQSKHRVAVEGALSEGKPVPQEVLKDYPEFQTTALAEGGTITGEAFEGTVEVTGLEPVKAIRKIHSNWIARRTQYDATKKALVAYVKKHVPLEARGKMLTSVQNVKTPLGLTKAILKADGYAEQAAQKTLRTQITSQLRRISPKNQYGRFTAEIQGKLNAIKANANEDRAKVYERIGDTIRAMDENKITPEDGQKALEILQISGLKGMTSGELAFALQEIKTLKATGRSLFAARKEAEAANFIPREVAIDQATGGKGLKAGRGTVSTEKLRPRITKPKEFVTFWQYGLDDVLDWISRFSKTKPYQSVFSQIGFGLHMARSIQQKGVIEYEAQTTNALIRIYNVKKGRQLWQMLRSMKHDNIDLGTFINAANEKVDISLTKGQVIQKYLEMQDPTLDETFRNPAPDGMKWTDEIMTAIRGAMTKEDIEFANWLTEFYQEYGKTIKTVFEDKYHIPFPDNPHWVHLTRVKESGDYAHLLMAMNGYRVAGIGNKSLIARKANKIALKFTDVLDVHDRHIIEMEHFKAFAVPMKQARMIFGDKEVRTAIEQYSGKEAVAHIDLHLDQIASDGKIGANIVEFIDKFRGHFTLAALGVKIAVSVKQALSLPAYLFYEQMPVRDFFTGVADFWAHPMQSIQEMKELSGHLSERWGSGHERDVRLVKAKDTAGRLSQYRNWRDLFMLGITKVDMATTSAGAWAVYKSMLKQGMSKADAITHAEIATDRTQPSFGLEDMAALRKQGSWGKLFTMFQSQPNKYYRAIASSIWNLKYGRGSKARNITTLLLALWVLPALFQLVTDGFQWKEEHQARVAILGAGNYLLAGGQILQGMWGHITGEPHEIEATPLFSTLNEIEWSLNGINKLLEQGKDPLQDVDTDQLVTTIEHISKLAGQMAGVPTPYAVQLERAIRNHDPRQIIFSQYALSNEEDVNKEYRDLYAQAWGYDNWKDMPEGDKNTAGTKAHFNSLNS